MQPTMELSAAKPTKVRPVIVDEDIADEYEYKYDPVYSERVNSVSKSRKRQAYSPGESFDQESTLMKS